MTPVIAWPAAITFACWFDGATGTTRHLFEAVGLW